MVAPERETTLLRDRRKALIVAIVCVAILTAAIVSALLISQNNNNAVSLSNEESQNTTSTTSTPSPAPSLRIPASPVSQENSSSSTPDSPTLAPTTTQASVLTQWRTFELLETVPHDPDAFTQGLVLVARDNNQHDLYEGTGLYGESDIRRVDLPTANVLLKTELPSSYFGEGIAYYETDSGEGRIIQLTWQEGLVFIYDSQTLEQISNATFSTTLNEGWGITGRKKDGDKMFIVSDGSSYLHFWNQSNLAEFRRVQVTSRSNFDDDDTQNEVRKLNELEWDPNSDTILANVWYSDTIQRIHPDTGFVIAQYDLSSLYPNRASASAVLNGIALVPGSSNEYWVTGKLWPNMFRIRLNDEAG